MCICTQLYLCFCLWQVQDGIRKTIAYFREEIQKGHLTSDTFEGNPEYLLETYVRSDRDVRKSVLFCGEYKKAYIVHLNLLQIIAHSFIYFGYGSFSDDNAVKEGRAQVDADDIVRQEAEGEV